MKYFLLFFLICLSCTPIKSQDYTIDNNGHRTIVTEHRFADKALFRAFKLVGTFTDNYGNYGNWDSFVTTFINEGKITNLDFSLRLEYQNKKHIYMQGYREEGTTEGAGVGRSIINAADNEFKSLINSKCAYSVKFLGDSFFGKNKCKLNKEALKELNNINEVND